MKLTKQLKTSNSKSNKASIRIIGIMLVLTLCFSSLVGCQSKKPINNKQDTEEEIVDLSWYINFSWFNTKWGGNVVSDAITKKMGVNVDFVTPSGDSFEKMQAMIDSDSLPDLITLGWWESHISQLIDNELVYPLDELADEYDPYFWEVTNEQQINWYTSENGHIYQYPNSSFSPSDYEQYDNLASNVTFLVRKDMYEAIGSPDMTTPEGFINAVEKAAEMFPEVDGKEMIPVGSHEFNERGCDSFDGFLLDFLAVPYMEDGVACDRLLDDDYVTWLKAYRELGAKGLLKDDIFVDSRTQMEEKIAEGRYFCMIYQRTDLEQAEMSLYNKNPDSVYIAIDGPKNSKGDDYKLPGTSINGWTVTLISKNCKYPEKAIKLMSYLISEEGQLMTWLGVEGVTWDKDSEGIPRMKPEVQELLDTDRTAFDNQYGADSCYWMFQNDAMASQWIEEDESSPLTQLKKWTYPYTTYVGQYTVTLDATSETGILKDGADSAWGTVLPQLLLASSEEEFDIIYADFVKERYETYKYQQVLDEMTVKMKENMTKLGITDEE